MKPRVVGFVGLSLLIASTALADPLDRWDRARAPDAEKVEVTLMAAEALLEQADAARNPDARKDLRRSARAMLEGIGAENSPDVRLRFALGEAVHRLDDDARTIAVLAPAVALAPTHPEVDRALLSLAIAYARSNHPVEEIRTYDLLLPNAQGRRRVLVLSNRAESKLRLLDFDGAIADYEEAIRLDPTGPAAFWGLSLAMDRTGDLGRALVLAKEAHDADRGPTHYLDDPNVFFVPAYEIEWYRALDDAMLGAQTDRAPADRQESWLSAAARWETYIAKAAKDDRWIPLAKARKKAALAAAQRLEREIKKATAKPRRLGGLSAHQDRLGRLGVGYAPEHRNEPARRVVECPAHRHGARTRTVEDEEQIATTVRAGGVHDVDDVRAIEVQLFAALRDEHATVGDEVPRPPRLEPRLDDRRPHQHRRDGEHGERRQPERHDQRDEPDRRRGHAGT